MEAEEYIEQIEREREEKEQLKKYLKEAKITTKNQAFLLDAYRCNTLRIISIYNGNHIDAIKGIVNGLDTAMKRAENQGTLENYNLLEMRLCAEISVKAPEKLELLLDEMSRQSITNSNAVDIARKIGIEEYLPKYLRVKLREVN